jgi:hypothetical protein
MKSEIFPKSKNEKKIYKYYQKSKKLRYKINKLQIKKQDHNK